MAVDLLAMEENLRWEGATNAEAKGWASIAVEKGKVTHGTPQKKAVSSSFLKMSCEWHQKTKANDQ